LAAYTGLSTTLTGKDGAELIRLSVVTSNLFTTLGVRPALGRSFSAAEDEPGQLRTAILSYGLWQRRFGGDTGISGRSIEESGSTITVDGVMPQGFSGSLQGMPGDPSSVDPDADRVLPYASPGRTKPLLKRCRPAETRFVNSERRSGAQHHLRATRATIPGYQPSGDGTTGSDHGGSGWIVSKRAVDSPRRGGSCASHRLLKCC
jgi:hypothetical protein